MSRSEAGDFVRARPRILGPEVAAAALVGSCVVGDGRIASLNLVGALVCLRRASTRATS